MKRQVITTDKCFWLKAGNPARARKDILYRRAVRTPSAFFGLIHV
jgi:hypothetical protein